MTNLAVLGTGHMGAAIARRLLVAGHRVTVWNRTPSRAAALAGSGAVIAETPAKAVLDADLIITMLTDATAVEAALFGPDAAVDATRSGAILVQMSTIGPDETRALAARLPTAISFLDAPVGGSVGAVDAGKLTIFAGGRDKVIEQAGPMLRDLGTVHDCGPVGTGTALKLVVNTAMITALGALHDSLAVADAFGIDRSLALDALTAGPLNGAIRRASNTDAKFAISLAAKDLRLALSDVRTAPIAAAAVQLLDDATDQRADLASLINLENR
ncbi:3-hydroxyisobutyrate dehydrogenase [Kribbella sp. VKM Ac-2527]|uniref:3-hydroxyisobutyrate dehydrogenase n=1 Tax=Kribbella caucasensis TaxID=2512215 RepID=A0A4R6KEL5_9ACTN|nr:NAD(P)-dependent oxidoreductase [Kribbella sp. VKM Ac-2527]TDO47158.1 3-hydroxyisobutyrate dehydrogenase [Kribbella sp. VKM Ac-2527]